MTQDYTDNTCDLKTSVGSGEWVPLLNKTTGKSTTSKENKVPLKPEVLEKLLFKK